MVAAQAVAELCHEEPRLRLSAESAVMLLREAAADYPFFMEVGTSDA